MLLLHFSLLPAEHFVGGWRHEKDQSLKQGISNTIYKGHPFVTHQPAVKFTTSIAHYAQG
jgi:hypothetical protein